MKVIPVKSIAHFLIKFDKYHNSGNFYFRGQADSIWDTNPGLGRNKNEVLNKLTNKIELKLINRFKKIISKNNLNNLIPFIKNSYHMDWQWLMSAQHYGLPTRLIDFSNNKYAALQFAIAYFENLNVDGALIIYCNPLEIQEDVDFEIFKSKHVPIQRSFFFPVPIYHNKEESDLLLGEHRKGIQGSKFLYRESSCITKCISSDDNLSRNLVKILIPKGIKLPLIKYLIDRQKFAYDIYIGRNDIDNYAAILKSEFLKLDENTIGAYLKNRN